ncbi:MAG: dCTP deaminase [Hapalosiphonaceae cyanobacterium JJU2]|nr:MAG: dCTP deaminase [Hapalosiphonaceae cyanobacterium JJU2]TBR60603.1 deoxycytidine triphosphate deaminase [Westiellopsis prolifica IICB1]
MILSDQDIITAINKGELQVSPLNQEFIQPASIDLTLCSTIRIFDLQNTEYIDIKEWIDPSKEVELEKDGAFLLRPDDFILGATVENITLPSYLAARVEGRSSLGRLGLMIQASAGYISPGFSGSITLEIKNISRIPLKLYVGMRIVQIIFEVMSSPALNPYGHPNSNHKYQYQNKPTSSKIWKDFKDS